MVSFLKIEHHGVAGRPVVNFSQKLIIKLMLMAMIIRAMSNKIEIQECLYGCYALHFFSVR